MRGRTKIIVSILLIIIGLGVWQLSGPDSVFNFHTSAVHEMRFTISYQLYDLFLFAYVSDHSSTRSFNITQSVV